MRESILSFFFLLSIIFSSHAQSCENTAVQHLADIPSVCAEITMTMQHDQMGKPYLYIAHKEAGLTIMDISSTSQPVEVANAPSSDLAGLDVMNLMQEGQYLYLALGNHFTNDQTAGMAIIDVADPTSPIVIDVWEGNDLWGGSGVVAVDGNTAYLGAMGHGLVLLDITDKTSVILLSVFLPDITFPDPNPDPAKYNARGMVVKNGLVYLCYDAGGLRIIDVSDKSMPMEVGRYSNPELNGLPRAYNNAVLDGDLLYVTVDYCGLEVLDVADPSQVTLTGWWNPWNCQSNPLNWFNSPGHANEIAYNTDCQALFLSMGKSDLYAIDVSDPSQPDSCFSWGGVSNGIGTWGVSVFENKIFLSYVCSFIPFASNWTGVKILEYDNHCVTAAEEEQLVKVDVFPNPVSEMVQVKMSDDISSGQWEIFQVNGTKIKTGQYRLNSFPIETDALASGIYFLKIADQDGRIAIEKLVK